METLQINQEQTLQDKVIRSFMDQYYHPEKHLAWQKATAAREKALRDIVTGVAD
jgi:hypothetical protein